MCVVVIFCVLTKSSHSLFMLPKFSAESFTLEMGKGKLSSTHVPWRLLSAPDRKACMVHRGGLQKGMFIIFRCG